MGDVRLLTIRGGFRVHFRGPGACAWVHRAIMQGIVSREWTGPAEAVDCRVCRNNLAQISGRTKGEMVARAPKADRARCACGKAIVTTERWCLFCGDRLEECEGCGLQAHRCGVGEGGRG